MFSKKEYEIDIGISSKQDNIVYINFLVPANIIFINFEIKNTVINTIKITNAGSTHWDLLNKDNVYPAGDYNLNFECDKINECCFVTIKYNMSLNKLTLYQYINALSKQIGFDSNTLMSYPLKTIGLKNKYEIIYKTTYDTYKTQKEIKEKIIEMDDTLNESKKNTDKIEDTKEDLQIIKSSFKEIKHYIEEQIDSIRQNIVGKDENNNFDDFKKIIKNLFKKNDDEINEIKKLCKEILVKTEDNKKLNQIINNQNEIISKLPDKNSYKSTTFLEKGENLDIIENLKHEIKKLKNENKRLYNQLKIAEDYIENNYRG